jgi:flagellar hook assembly protein FlgD
LVSILAEPVTFKYALKEPGHVTLRVYNALGQLVRTLVNEQREPGSHSVAWDGRDDAGAVVSSGAYFYQVKAVDYVQVKKMIMLK